MAQASWKTAFLRSMTVAALVSLLPHSYSSLAEPHETSLVKHRHRHERHKRQQFGFYFHQNFTVGLGEQSEEQGPWGPWTESSECSRPCGGGVAHQTRICMDARQDGSQSCLGASKRYFSCNIQDCPVGTKDFREEQCARFNTVPFEGRHYSWVPYTKAPNPCELNCKPKGERFYFRQDRKVIDGTRCRDDGSLDVCVEGVCMPVGCDMMLGSEVKEDRCRECGGDGSSCKTIEGLFEFDNLQVGYNDILLIPAGATNILVEEKYPTNNYLAIRNVSGHYYLNGNWRIEFPREMKFAGTTFNYERKPHGFLAPEKVTALGPTVEAIFIVLLYQEQNKGISYEYSIPLGASNLEPDTYTWSFGDYEQCSASCGGGMQRRPLACTRSSDHETVDEYLCNPHSKPESERPCNTHPCSASWHTGEWLDCVGPCNNGRQFRQVSCQQQKEGGEVVLVDEFICAQQEEKPPYVQACTMEEACPVWKTTPWSACSRVCGDGLQTRKVTCQRETRENGEGRDEGELEVETVDEALCSGEEKPKDTQSCNQGPCEGVEWVLSDWTGCDTTCGLLLESREAFCSSEKGKLYNSAHCESSPDLTRDCAKTKACEAMWHTSQWSQCSAKCGSGIQTRVVFCGIWEGDTLKKVAEDQCDPELKFVSAQNCTAAPCIGQWFSGPWNRCSVPCGGGTKTRQTLCIENEEVIPSNQCDPDTEPLKTEACNQKPCDEDEVMMVGGCKKSRYGCCPDGLTPAGANYEGCPRPESDKDCAESEYGCCFDGVTPAFGPYKKGCPVIHTCNDTKLGCCPDGVTPVKPGKECPEVTECKESLWGCCLDQITPATGANSSGCEDGPAKSGVDCEDSPHGCCPDNATAADGPNNLGCDAGEPSGQDCQESTHGCCLDGTTSATGPNAQGCPSNDTEITPTDCSNSTYGCCADGVTAALGTDLLGCEEFGSGEEDLECNSTFFGCCPDNITAAKGPDFEGCEEANCTVAEYGCCPDNITAATGPDYEGCTANCSASEFGCCPDNVTSATGPEYEGCDVSNCSLAEFGCCDDNATLATGPNKAGCEEGECANSTHGCCPDKVTAAQGPDHLGCCNGTEFGCCPDSKTPAMGPRYAGCGCNTSPYGCCPDGISLAFGERYYGCTCDSYPFGCCQDRYFPAQGPNFFGCICQYMRFGCCGDGVTPAAGPNQENCDCRTTQYGCCPDNKTPAKGPLYEGCPCQIMPFSCCPDGVSVARGPNYEGCACSSMQFGCCPDGVTPARGHNLEGCQCEYSPYGCCPDRKTAAQGQNHHGCPCVSMPYGCCPDLVTPARGPDNQGCPCDKSPFGCCPDGVTLAQGPENSGCAEVPKPTDVKIPGEVCSLPNDRGSCGNYTVNWFFDMNYGGCSRFWYGGCNGNGNRFQSQEECERTCVTPEGTDACLLPKVKGPCDGNYAFWYYDSARGTCDQFYYGGCLGNNNRFATQELCQQTCVSEALDRCEQPLVHGPCTGSFPRFYYDRYDARCKRFDYSGCKSNDNIFETEGECTESCPTVGDTSVCVMPRQEGTCAKQFQRFYFDYREKNCREFTYTGCQGNKNRFVTLDQCQRVCNLTLSIEPLVHICKLPKDEGSCSQNEIKWFYNDHSSRCEQFYYGGCEGNSNRFDSRRHCEHTCLPHEERNICMLPFEAGTCHEFREAFYFSARDGQCRRFYYSGCGGNENNFADYQQCEERCGKPSSTELPEAMHKKEFCFLDRDPGPCHTNVLRWFYDHTDGVCKEFYYGSCEGNGNRFRSQAECHAKCADAQDICDLPQVRGPCSRDFIQWFYDANLDECHSFTYGGCQGNPNRFNDKDSCEIRCKKEIVPQPPTTTPPPTTTTTTTTTPAPYTPPRRPPEVTDPDDVCQQPRDRGQCLGTILQWYYSRDENICRQFYYGGCEGNGNRFQSREKCEGMCVKPDFTTTTTTQGPTAEDDTETNEEVCRRPMDPGSCEEKQTRFYFDWATSSCLPFMYKGCGGNRNRFKTKDLCMRFCTPTGDDNVIDEPSKPDMVPPTQEISPGGCPPSPLSCREMRCPFGIEEHKDAAGCFIDCNCYNPCKNYTCSPGYKCALDVRRGEDNQPYPHPECRQVVKPGQCPVQNNELNSGQGTRTSRSECRDYCRDDADCLRNYKCCYSGCAYICIAPDGFDEITTAAFPVEPPTTTQTFTERPEAPRVTILGGPELTLDQGATLNLTCVVRNEVPPSQVWWYHQGRVVNFGPLRGDVSIIRTVGDPTISQLVVPNIQESDAGNYTCLPADMQPANAIVRVVPREPVTTTTLAPAVPDVDTLPVEKQVVTIVGADVTLRCQVKGQPLNLPRWNKDDLEIEGDDGHYTVQADGSLYITKVKEEDAGVFVCTVEIVYYGYVSRSFNLVVNAPPRILPGAPKHVVASLGQPVTLQCRATGSPVPSVSWFFGPRMLPSSSSRFQQFPDFSLLIRRVVETDSGRYVCEAFNGIGSAVKSSVSLSLNRRSRRSLDLHDCTLNPKEYNGANAGADGGGGDGNETLELDSAGSAPLLLETSEPLSVDISLATPYYRAGSPLQLDCLVKGYRAQSVEWFYGGDSAPLVTNERVHLLDNHTLLIHNATVSDSGNYRCIASNEFGQASSLIAITIEEVYIPPDCTDNPRFANCALIVRANYCNNYHYGRFCCRSCRLAGQSVPHRKASHHNRPN